MLRTPRAFSRLEDSPATWWRTRLRSPTRPPEASDNLWRQLTELAAIYRHRRSGRPDWVELAAADTVPPGASDTVLPGEKPALAPDDARPPEIR